MNDKDEWNEDDAIWNLLGKAPRPVASSRFVDDTLRAIRQLPMPHPWWRKIHFLAPIGLAASCAAISLFLSISPESKSPSLAHIDSESSWEQMEAAAHEEFLIAAAQDPGSFSDEELFSLVGF